MIYNFACVLATYVGERDDALRLLDRSLSASGEMQVRVAEADSDFDCLRDDPRFQQIIGRAKKRLRMSEAARDAVPKQGAA